MDRLYDVTASLPGLAEDLLMAGQHRHPEHAVRIATQADLKYQELRIWRYDWERENPRAAKVFTAYDPSKISSSTSQECALVRRLLAREIRFENLDQSLEIFSYNSALVYLYRLKELLRFEEQPRGCLPTQEDMHHINNQLLDGERPSPLLLPDSLKLSYQPALEAVQQCAYIAAELRCNNPINFIALAPVGIIYCSLKSLGTFGEPLSAAIAGTFSASSALDQLEVFGIWKPLEHLTCG